MKSQTIRPRSRRCASGGVDPRVPEAVVRVAAPESDDRAVGNDDPEADAVAPVVLALTVRHERVEVVVDGEAPEALRAVGTL